MAKTIEGREATQKLQYIPYSQILEAIAKGVEARLLRTVIVNVVTIESMCIARKLNIPEEEIQEWRSSRFSRSQTIEDCSFLLSKGEGKLIPPNFRSSLTEKK
jgi:hypothetical protein